MMLCNSTLVAEEAAHSMPIELNKETVEYSKQEKHLGIERLPSGKNAETINSRIRAGRRTAYALMGAGLCGLNGVSPEVSIPLINVYVMPTITHSLEALKLTDPEYEELERHQRLLLRQIQHLPQSTATPALYLLTGTLPMRAIVHKKILTFFGNIMRKETGIEKDVIRRQLAVKDLYSNSWVTQVRELLHLYKLPSAYDLMEAIPTKYRWKKMVKSNINAHWLKTLKEEADCKKTLCYINQNSCKIGQVHPIWQCGPDPIQTTMATTKARLLVQRYALAGTHCAGKNRKEHCPLCQGPPETLLHFIIECPYLEDCRQPYLKKIKQTMPTTEENPPSNEELLQTILDPSAIPNSNLEEITRRMCFSLHNKRCVTLGGTSPFVIARVRTGRENSLYK